MTEIIKVEKNKLIKIVELARNNRGINIDDLLQLAMVEVEPKKEVEKEVEYEQEIIELDPEEVIKKDTKKEKVYRKRRWTTGEEQNFIKMVESEVDYGYMAKKFKRSKNALYNKAHELREAGRLDDMNIKMYPNSNKPYSESEEKLMQDVINKCGGVTKVHDWWLNKLSSDLGRSTEAIRTRLYFLQDKEF